MERYKKFAIDLSKKNGDSNDNVFDVRRSLQVKPKLLTNDKESKRNQQELLASVTERMKVRDLAASRRLKGGTAVLGDTKFGLSIAGKASDNYNTPFSYI